MRERWVLGFDLLLSLAAPSPDIRRVAEFIFGRYTVRTSPR
jgi:hypothetical protein